MPRTWNGPAPTSSPTTCPLTGTRPGSRGPPSMPTPSAGCASGSSPRSSPASPARTSRSPTCRKRSAPRPPRARARGCTGACPPWSPQESAAGTWPAPGSRRCTGRPPAGPAPRASTQGESDQFVGPAQIPADADVARLGQALAAGRRGDLHELMANTAAYSGLRQGEEFALTIWQITPASRVIDVDRKVIEVAGKLLTGLPKGSKRRKTIYPARTPHGYPLAEKIQARINAARTETEAGTNPLGLMFPSPRGHHWRSSNFDRRVLAPAYQPARWRDPAGNGNWTWHSLRHVFCVTALFTWHLEPHDVAPLAGHATARTTLDMYIGTTAGILDRAHTATA